MISNYVDINYNRGNMDSMKTNAKYVTWEEQELLAKQIQQNYELNRGNTRPSCSNDVTIMNNTGNITINQTNTQHIVESLKTTELHKVNDSDCIVSFFGGLFIIAILVSLCCAFPWLLLIPAIILFCLFMEALTR